MICQPGGALLYVSAVLWLSTDGGNAHEVVELRYEARSMGAGIAKLARRDHKSRSSSQIDPCRRLGYGLLRLRAWHSHRCGMILARRRQASLCSINLRLGCCYCLARGTSLASDGRVDQPEVPTYHSQLLRELLLCARPPFSGCR
jgi:hypothetical protein